MREPLLDRNPEAQAVTLSELVGIASAVEHESVARYAALAETMARRGEVATAAAFRVMHDEERKHVDAVTHWAASLGEPPPEAWRFSWRLPPDLASSWQEVAGSARLTPYRAFAIAVDNEQRAFALYSYIAAYADDPRVAAEAERLALEELRHASVMRRWRRQAWHRERRGPLVEQPAIESAAMLRALLARCEADVVVRLGAIASRLRAAGDSESAQLVEGVMATPTQPPGALPAATEGDAAVLDDDPVHLLVAAQAPLESLCETLEQIMKTIEGELFTEAEHALTNVVARMARISARRVACMQGQAMDLSSD